MQIDPTHCYTTKEVAAFLKVSTQTARRLMQDGALKCRRWSKRAHYRVTGENLLKFLRGSR